ncbi:MAG TPA: sodium:alanine symporter family protein [Longimicrobiales bacterium]|nr:sodium:alanine symporter family protein [Longimicrobiales bacterium]
MEGIEQLIGATKSFLDNTGIPVAGETIPFKVIVLLGAGIFLTLRLGFVQFRHLFHGFAVTTGRYDDPAEPGDVSHFQALTTALSATVGIGNIAGAAWAIHYGGPGALFWMWVTALLGMATKFSEVTLAQRYRSVEADQDPIRWEGTVSGGPMYYIERGLGPAWKPLAVFFAIMLGFTAFITGNAVQANTLADTMESTFAIPNYVTGLVAAGLISAVIVGGISRIGRVTGILAPVMAAIYVTGAVLIILLNIGELLPAISLILTEAFNPSAGVAGTGVGALLVTLNWGVDRGLFSNEAGQGSAPIAHAAAKTDEPVSEGVVGLVEPFIDTIVIVSMTALVIIMTGTWDLRVPSEVTIAGGDVTYRMVDDETGSTIVAAAPTEIRVVDGAQESADDAAAFAWHDVIVDRFYLDLDQTTPFSGTITPGGAAVGLDGTTYTSLYADAPEGGAPLTMLAFRRGLAPIGDFGHWIVIISVLLFGISTAISWSYYGDRCARYLMGKKAVLPYKFAYVAMFFVGAIIAPASAWELGDIALAIVIIPNLLALVLLSGEIRQMMDSYFERKPWIENAEVHRRLKQEGKV